MAQYLHPSVDTKIVDNSAVFQTADGTSTLFAVIQSELGPDSKMNLVTTPEEFVFKYGTPNLSKYGQASYNVINWLKAGGIAYVLRILPSTSTYAMGGVGVAIAKTTDNTDPDNPVTSAQVAVLNFTAASQQTSQDGIRTWLSGLRKIEADKATIPLGIVIPFGRGDGYNGLGFQLALRDDLDATYPFRSYNFTVTAKDSLGNDVEVDGPFIVSFDPTARNKSRESMYWASVINKYSKYVRVIEARNGAEDAGEFLLGEDSELNPMSIDLLFGQPIGTTIPDELKNVTWVHRENAADLVPALPLTPEQLFNGNAVSTLAGGKIGAWTGADSEDALLVRAYTGLMDPSILDKNYEIDMLLDANHTNPVKSAIGALADNLRGDCMALLDLNFQADEEQTLNYRTSSVTAVASRNVAIFAHDMEVYDEFNGENIKVTSTYLLAGKIPVIDRENGIQYTFVGPRRGTISGFENINFIPNPTWREAFYKAKINYIERDPRKINFATQLTTQAQNSALSDINNVRVLLRIRREVEQLLADYRMEFNDPITHDAANYDLANYLQKWTANRACSSISGVMSASDYDRQQKLAKVLITLQFTGIMERIEVSIVVNR